MRRKLIGSKLVEKFDTHWSFDGDNTEIMMDTLITNDSEILNIVKDIDVKKASSIENLSTRVLKDAFMILIPQLTYMYNLSFMLRTFPDSWKISNVVPLQKSGDPTDVNNLRPVSLLALPGKIAEKIAHKKINAYLMPTDHKTKFGAALRSLLEQNSTCIQCSHSEPVT